MKIHVDMDRCQGHGQCVMKAPDVFDLGIDDDKVTVLNDEPSEDQRDAVELAVDVCPTQAISIDG